MTLKERLEDFWRNGRVFNPCHLNWWNSAHGFEIDKELILFCDKGRKVELKIKKRKYPLGRSDRRYTPQGLRWYRAERARFVEDVNKARRIMGLPIE